MLSSYLRFKSTLTDHNTMRYVNKLAIVGGSRSLAGSLIWPFTAFALFKVYHLSLDFISIYFIIQGIVGIVAYLLGGYLTDLLGRVRVLVLSALFSSVSLFLAYLTNTQWSVVTFILIQTFFNSLYNVANTSLVGDLNRNFSGLVKDYSRIRVGINAGWAVGPAIGGLLFYSLGFRVLLLISSLILLPLVPLLLSLPEVKGNVRISLQVDRTFLKFLIPTFLTFMVMGQLGFSLLTFYNTIFKLTTFQVGLLFLENGLIIVALQEIVGRKLSFNMISMGMLIYSIAYFAVAFSSNFILAILDMGFITLAEMIVSPLSQALASYLSEKNTRGRKMGVYNMVTALGRTSGSSYVSYLMNYYLSSPAILWSNVAIIGVISAVLYYFLVPVRVTVERRD